MKNNSCYTSITNNCSDLAVTALNAIFNMNRRNLEIFTDEYYFINYTTPNGVYRFTRDFLKDNPNRGKIIKNPWNKVEFKFKDCVL